MTLSPIVLFVYNRRWLTQQTIEALQKNEFALESELFIYSDAEKSDKDKQAVKEVRSYVKSIDGFQQITIIEREENWGLANSVIDGVTTIVNKYGKVIVLEDDLVTSPYFLKFINGALDQYKEIERVIQVSGYMFPVELDIIEDSLFLPLTTSWGWATWKESWQLFDPSTNGYEQIRLDMELRNSFNLGGAYDYFSMLEEQLAGKIDSWAIRWQLSTFLAGGLTLYPRHSLVVNMGFDGSGVHGAMSGNVSRSGAVQGFEPKNFPEVIEVGTSWKLVCDFLWRRLSWFARARKWLQTLV